MIKYHAQFLLDKEKDNPTAKLRYRIKWSGFIVAFNVGYRIEIDKWSKETQRCKINTTHGDKKVPANVINRKIQRYEEVCENIFTKFNAENKIPTADEFRAEFNKEIGKEKKSENELSFFEVYDLFVKEEGKKNVWTKATYQKMETQKRYLLEFDSNISFKDFTESKLIEFQYYLQEELKLKNSTLLKRFSFLRWFLRWALRKKYISDNTFETFRPKLKTTQKKIIFLTQSELEKLKECNIPSQKQYLERVRDVFLFQCFTGLRYSDVANLKKSNIKDDSIHITTIKTTDSLVIELNKYSKALIDKYNVDMKRNADITIVNDVRSVLEVEDRPQTIGILTNDFHIFRAMHVAKKLGYTQVFPIRAGSNNILYLHMLVRETFAILKYKFLGYM